MGIISTAIANAEKLPPQQGQENMSLLQQHSSTKRGPASSQFTFTCDSQVPGTFAWSGSTRRLSGPLHQAPVARTANEAWSRGPQATQNSHTPPPAPQIVDPSKETLPRSNMGNQQTSTQKGSRRGSARDYTIAAMARRRETQLNNRRNPPKPEDVWICYFCDYEQIFGQPPAALVRQYEIKDRKQRQADQRLKANWEKMKKGKHKGKKSSKLPTKSDVGHDGHHNGGGHSLPMQSNCSQDTQSEEYEDDDYEDDDQEYDPEDDMPSLESEPVGLTPQKHNASLDTGGSAALNDGGGT